MNIKCAVCGENFYKDDKAYEREVKKGVIHYKIPSDEKRGFCCSVKCGSKYGCIAYKIKMQKIYDEYAKNPVKCKYCGKMIEYKKKKKI